MSIRDLEEIAEKLLELRDEGEDIDYLCLVSIDEEDIIIRIPKGKDWLGHAVFNLRGFDKR